MSDANRSIITRRRLLSLLPLPGIAIAAGKLLPDKPAIATPPAAAHVISPGQRFLFHIDGWQSPEDCYALERELRDRGIDATVLAHPDLKIYELAAARGEGDVCIHVADDPRMLEAFPRTHELLRHIREQIRRAA